MNTGNEKNNLSTISELSKTKYKFKLEQQGI